MTFWVPRERSRSSIGWPMPREAIVVHPGRQAPHLETHHDPLQSHPEDVPDVPLKIAAVLLPTSSPPNLILNGIGPAGGEASTRSPRIANLDVGRPSSLEQAVDGTSQPRRA